MSEPLDLGCGCRICGGTRLLCVKHWGERMNDPVRTWLRDYVAMMEANLGIFHGLRTEGLYEGAVERILEVRQYLKETVPEPPPHSHLFRGPIAPSLILPGVMAESRCECGAEIVRERK